MARKAEVHLFEEGESVGDVIRRVFVELGGNVPAREVTNAIIDRQLLPPETLKSFLVRGLTERVRHELGVKTDEGLPFAQPTGVGKNDPWLQLDLFDRDAAHGLIQRRIKNLDEDYSELVRLHTWCLEKFGDAPRIPILEMPS